MITKSRIMNCSEQRPPESGWMKYQWIWFIKPLLPSRQMSNSNQLQMCCWPSSVLFNYISEAVFTLFTSYWAHSSLSHGSLTSQWLNIFCWWQLWLLADLRLPAGHSMGGSWQWIGRCLWVSPGQAGLGSVPSDQERLRCHVWPLVALLGPLCSWSGPQDWVWFHSSPHTARNDRGG